MPVARIDDHPRVLRHGSVVELGVIRDDEHTVRRFDLVPGELHSLDGHSVHPRRGTCGSE